MEQPAHERCEGCSALCFPRPYAAPVPAPLWPPPEVAEDISQESFARICAVDDEAIASPRALLFQTARNLAIDEVRRRDRSPVRGAADFDQLEIASSEPNPEEQLLRAEATAAVQAALNKLPPHKREALVLFKVEGYSYKEIGKRLGVSHRTVERYVADAIAHCHKELRALRED